MKIPPNKITLQVYRNQPKSFLGTVDDNYRRHTRFEYKFQIEKKHSTDLDEREWSLEKA